MPQTGPEQKTDVYLYWWEIIHKDIKFVKLSRDYNVKSTPVSKNIIKASNQKKYVKLASDATRLS